MARIRTIKPEFFTSEDIVKLSLIGRLLYIALWCEADREGRLVWKPATFKLRYMPGDDCDINKVCKEILDRHLAVLYGDGYAYIPSFLSHQHINPRETPSQLPDPIASRSGKSRVGTRAARVSDAQVGREGKGKEGKDKYASFRFLEFWTAWPANERKQDKEKCFENWKDQSLQDIADTILADIAVKKQTQKWQGGFIEAPLVYLHNVRWQDGVVPNSTEQSAVIDPDSRASIEAEGEAKGIGRWNESTEQWHVYKARVRGNPALGLTLTQLARMAPKQPAGVPA